MGKNRGDDTLVFDTHHSIESLNPGHHCTPLSPCWRLALVHRPLGTSASLGRRYAGTVFAVRCEYAVKASEVDPRFRYPSHQEGNKIERLEDDVSRAITVRGLQFVTDVTVAGKR